MSSNYTSPQNNTNDEIDLTQLLSTLWFYKWYIAIITILFGLGGAWYALTAQPVYQADAMLEITSGKNNVLGNLSELLSSSQNTPADTEIELIKSRLILGKTVDELHLNTVITPKISIIDKLFNPNKIAKISIDNFDVDTLLNGKQFTLYVQNPQVYTITDPNGHAYTGRVGQTLNVNNVFSLNVKQIQANTGQEFSINHYSRLESIDLLSKNLNVAAKGKNIPIIGLSLNGRDPELIETTLNSIIKYYTNENKEKSIQTAKSGLKFINDELPRLHNELTEAENRLNFYRSKNKSLDLPSETKGTLESLNKIEMQIVDLKTEESVLSEVYTKDHPSYKAIQDKLKVLTDAKERLNKQIVKLPETQQEVIRLTRNVEINQAIYVQLLNKQQELGILQASTQGSVRLIDQAITEEQPIKPQKTMIIALATLIGLFLSSMTFLLKSFMHKGISSEEEITALGANILGSIPVSKQQRLQDAAFKKTSLGKRLQARSNYLLSIKAPEDAAIEALRGLRTNLYFTSLDAANNIIMISGATPEVGKSFISANLAILMAQTKKILLIDADLRKGYLHHLLDVPAGKGLPEILHSTGSKHYANCIERTNYSSLDFISCGASRVNNPAELLNSNTLPEFLQWASNRYDYVVIDTPPILAVTDPAIIGNYAGLSLIVSRFNKTSIAELEESITRFKNSNVNINGIILNGVERTANNSYRYVDYKYSENKTNS